MEDLFIEQIATNALVEDLSLIKNKVDYFGNKIKVGDQILFFLLQHMDGDCLNVRVEIILRRTIVMLSCFQYVDRSNGIPTFMKD